MFTLHELEFFEIRGQRLPLQDVLKTKYKVNLIFEIWLWSDSKYRSY